MAADPPVPDPAGPNPPSSTPSGWQYAAGQDARTTALATYLEANRGKFTDEALRARATEAGYTRDEIDRSLQLLRSVEAATPVRKRARQVVLAAYLVTYVALDAGMLLNPQNYGAAPIGIAVLSLFLGGTLAIALALVRRARARPGTDLALAGVVAVPMILLLLVAGICVASGVPIPRIV